MKNGIHAVIFSVCSGKRVRGDTRVCVCVSACLHLCVCRLKKGSDEKVTSNTLSRALALMTRPRDTPRRNTYVCVCVCKLEKDAAGALAPQVSV